MNPAFSPSALRDITPTFFELSYKLRDKWLALLGDKAVDPAAYKDEEIAKVESAKLEEGTIVIEISKWMSRLTLDIIGLSECIVPDVEHAELTPDLSWIWIRLPRSRQGAERTCQCFCRYDVSLD
jgi:hypothetical protein